MPNHRRIVLRPVKEGQMGRTLRWVTAAELKSLRTCVDRSRPYGGERWVEEIAERHGLWHTVGRA